MHRKKVLVTGSSRGIGRACALAFAEAGYHVFINCRNSIDRLDSLEREILDIGGTCTKIPGDAGRVVWMYWSITPGSLISDS